MRCDASYRGLSASLRVWQLRKHLPYRFCSFEFMQDWDGHTVKMGQCSISIGLKYRVFADRLQILPQYADLWPVCMQAVLSELGPGRYVYGSEWSLEPPRERDLAALPGVSIVGVKQQIVEAVDFARWGTWREYMERVSPNIRRNIKRVRVTLGSPEIKVKRGAAALKLVWSLFRCKIAMYKRKAVPIRRSAMIFGHVLRLVTIPRYVFCVALRHEGRTLAAIGGVEVGRSVYYFDGGSIKADGTGWLLKMALMEEFYARCPDGKFLLGTNSFDASLPSHWESRSRYRRDCRATGFPTSIVTFIHALGSR